MSDDEKTLRSLLVSAHEKLDTVLRIQRDTTADRLKDRGTIQRHGRRIDTLEHQVALLTEASPGLPSWHPNARDVAPSDFEIVLDAPAPTPPHETIARWRAHRRWILILAVCMFLIGAVTSGLTVLALRGH